MSPKAQRLSTFCDRPWENSELDEYMSANKIGWHGRFWVTNLMAYLT